MNDPRSTSQRDVLASRFAFDTWPAVRDPAAHVSGFGFGELDLPGYRQHRVVDAPPPPGALAAHESVWVDVEKPTSDDAILLVDVYECESPEQAREVLLGLLGQIESSSVDRVEGLGEVAFSPGEGALFYVRDNLAVRVMSGGPAIESVAEPARRLDDDIRRRSEGDKGSP
jgi:hypothetical protein